MILKSRVFYMGTDKRVSATGKVYNLIGVGQGSKSIEVISKCDLPNDIKQFESLEAEFEYNAQYKQLTLISAKRV